MHRLKLTVFYTAYESSDQLLKFDKTFLVDVQKYCRPSLVTKTSMFNPSQMTYVIS